ncbi:MAG: hypothetical protein M1157_08410 [Deinococcus sp.]|nr:hypothetical protein [Deinococcus sp.]
MKRSALWLGIAALALVGVAFTQGMWGGPGYGQGMMGQGYGTGTMGGHGMMMSSGMGMMGGVYPAQIQPIAKEEAKRRLEAYAARLGPDAKVKDFMVFSENYYAQVVNAKGEGMAEILADRYTGNVYPEPGPNMMWNTRYGMGGSFGTMGGQGSGMMGYGGQPAAQPAPVRYDNAAAQALVVQFLKGYLPGAKVMEGTAFPGYYTFDFGRKDLEGMLSVNAYTGEVWVHTWHGVSLGN